MAAKKIALDLLLNIQKSDITLEELNEQLQEAKNLLEQMGDDGSKEFKALSAVIEKTESDIESFNSELDKSKKGFDETSKAQKDAAKGSSLFSKGIKAIGVGLKALGIGVVVGAIKLFFDAIQKNERIMTFFETVLGTISILFEQLFTAVFDAVDAVSQATNGFSGLTKVAKGLLTIAITPLKLAFLGISLSLKQAQLAWEQSFFGGKDEDKIKELQKDIKQTQKDIKETALDAVNAGQQVIDNFGDAINEVTQVVTKSSEGISKISIKAASNLAKTNKELEKSAQIAAAQQQLLIEKYDRQAEQQRQIRDDETKSIADRIKANNELENVLNKQEEAMLAAANAQIASASATLQANRNTENEVSLIEALANKKAIEAQIEGFRSEQKVNAVALQKEELALNKQLSDSEAQLSFERRKYNAEQIEDEVKRAEALRDLYAEEQQEELLRLETILEATQAGTQAEVDALIALDEFKEESRQQNLEANKAVLEATQKATEESNKKIKQDEEELADKRIELANLAFGAISNIANALAQGNEQQQRKAFKINKAVNIAQAAMNTGVAVTAALTAGGNPIKLATGAQFLEAGLVAAAGAAQIATIAKTKFNANTGGIGNTNIQQPAFGGNNVGIQPRGFARTEVDTDVPTTKVIVTETDIRNVSRDIDGVYSRATVVE